MISRIARSLLVGLVIVVWAAAAHVEAAQRTWTDHAGQVTTAELSGVKDGFVVLRQGQKRIYAPFPQFVLEDREFIVESFKERKQESLLQELMNKALRDPAGTSPPPTPFTVTGGASASGLRPPAIPAGGVGTPTPAPVGAPAPTIMYGVSIPSHDLLYFSEPRTWTDLMGRSYTARFEGVVSPANLVLREPGSYRTNSLPLVNFSKADIEWVREFLQNDLQREIFPPGQWTELTDAQRTEGYRTWTDRLGVRLNAKYSAHEIRDGKNEVVLLIGAEPRRFPYNGHSQVDHDWIKAETARRHEEARERAEEARQRAEERASQNWLKCWGCGYTTLEGQYHAGDECPRCRQRTQVFTTHRPSQSTIPGPQSTIVRPSPPVRPTSSASEQNPSAAVKPSLPSVGRLPRWVWRTLFIIGGMVVFAGMGLAVLIQLHRRPQQASRRRSLRNR